MRHGGYYPDMKLRLFRRVTGAGVAHFTDRPVHESVTVAGRVETMTRDFLHHGYPNLEVIGSTRMLSANCVLMPRRALQT